MTTVRDDRPHHRFVFGNDGAVGELTYEVDGDRMFLLHTEASGNMKVVAGSAITRPPKAGSSTPAPTHAPCTRVVTFGPSSANHQPALRVPRTKCPVTGSGVAPNSLRSPPLQNVGPAPS